MKILFRWLLPVVAIVAVALAFLLLKNQDHPKQDEKIGASLPQQEAAKLPVAAKDTLAPDYTLTSSTEEPSIATSTAIAAPADAATILARKQVPILCYHQIRDWRSSDSQAAKDYIVPEQRFKEQLQVLADSGYQTILPDQLLAYLTTGAPLPAKPIMLTFDDTNLDQYTIAAPELEKHGFKGVFFVMTVSLGRPRYMNKEQVKELVQRGHTIGCHTWDHRNVKKYGPQDWLTQVEKPTKQLEDIVGQPIQYFAYPFGLWNPEAIPELKSRGYQAAFILSTKRDEQDPLHTIRRLIASGHWSAERLHKNVQQSF